jgi:hypothetical protein
MGDRPCHRLFGSPGLAQSASQGGAQDAGACAAAIRSRRSSATSHMA